MDIHGRLNTARYRFHLPSRKLIPGADGLLEEGKWHLQLLDECRTGLKTATLQLFDQDDVCANLEQSKAWRLHYRANS